MNLSNVTTSDLLNELANRPGVEEKTTANADLILTVRDLDAFNDTKTFEFSTTDNAAEMIDQVNALFDLLRNDWRRLDHWRMGDSLMVSVRRIERVK